ncbi:hypothetical protein BDA96_04G073100 [Sorghum bicolor]|jgi:hypothetical protein|uniref:Uncharacterized protein n=3 Tax=Sorghum bicolor TaxID=4558 RepID=A0A921R155_SORBI|nr:hypothetical protein BDA96_04G073100 [Sorghum bicolor]OQU84504.1 hypothetical protein SORBI_3004G067600 [Sorghum bicolor]
MEAAASLSSASLSVLRHSLRATVCCFVSGGSSSGGLGERMRWRRRAGAGDFRYDPLSYALNFDEGDHGGVDGEEEDRAGGRLVDAFLLSSQLVTRRPGAAAVVEAA